MDITELKRRQAQGELSEAEAEAVIKTKRDAEAVKTDLGDLLTGHKRSLKTRIRRKPTLTIPDYQLDGVWASYYEVATVYEAKVPTQDREDIRHDIMIELDRATKRDGKPLPILRAYRIASLMVALYYRSLNRFSTRVCVYNGYPTEPHCKGCRNKSEGKRCMWLAVRPVARLDGEIIDEEGYRTRLLDTVASDKIADMPDQWYELKSLLASFPLRLAEIAHKRLEGKSLEAKDRMYLSRYWKAQQKSLF